MRVDPFALGELVEQRAIEAARGAVIDILDDGVVAQPGIAQAGGEALVAAMGDLAIDQQAEPFGVGERRAFAGGFEFGEGLGHAGEPELGELIEDGMGQHFHSPNQLMVVAGAADVGVEDRGGVGGPRLRGLAIELVVEDRAHRAVGQRADLDGARGCRLETHRRRTARTRRTMPRQERKPCSGCGRCSRISSHKAAVAGPIAAASLANALDRPIGVSAMARRHVIGASVVCRLIAAGAQMRGDPLALEEDLDGARRQPHLDLAPGEAVGHAVEVRLDLDVIVDADPPQPPFGKA